MNVSYSFDLSSKWWVGIGGGLDRHNVWHLDKGDHENYLPQRLAACTPYSSKLARKLCVLLAVVCFLHVLSLTRLL